MTPEEKQVAFYEDHLKRLEKKKDELNWAFYTSEKSAIEAVIAQLKTKITND